MIRSTMIGTVTTIRDDRVVVILVDDNGHAYIPIEVVPPTIRKVLKIGDRIVITETKMGPDDTGEWSCRILRGTEYTKGRSRKEKLP